VRAELDVHVQVVQVHVVQVYGRPQAVVQFVGGPAEDVDEETAREVEEAEEIKPETARETVTVA